MEYLNTGLNGLDWRRPLFSCKRLYILLILSHIRINVHIHVNATKSLY